MTQRGTVGFSFPWSGVRWCKGVKKHKEKWKKKGKEKGEEKGKEKGKE